MAKQSPTRCKHKACQGKTSWIPLTSYTIRICALFDSAHLPSCLEWQFKEPLQGLHCWGCSTYSTSIGCVLVGWYHQMQIQTTAELGLTERISAISCRVTHNAYFAPISCLGILPRPSTKDSAKVWVHTGNAVFTTLVSFYQNGWLIRPHM